VGTVDAVHAPPPYPVKPPLPVVVAPPLPPVAGVLVSVDPHAPAAIASAVATIPMIPIPIVRIFAYPSVTCTVNLLSFKRNYSRSPPRSRCIVEEKGTKPRDYEKSFMIVIKKLFVAAGLHSQIILSKNLINRHSLLKAIYTVQLFINLANLSMFCQKCRCQIGDF
jgi:hypothetical protein